MEHGISEIVDYLLAQVQQAGETEKRAFRRPGQGGTRLDWPPRPEENWGGLASSRAGLSPETIVNLISQDMLDEEEMQLYFPVVPIEMHGLVCHRLLVLPTPDYQPLVLTVYYHPGCALNIDQPRYVVDNDVWVENNGQFWSFISVVTGSGAQARRFIETFINRLGFMSSFEVTEDGGRLSVARVRCH